MPHVVWTRIIIKIGVLNCVMLPKPTSVPQWGVEAVSSRKRRPKRVHRVAKPHFTQETVKSIWKGAFVGTNIGTVQPGNWITGSGRASHTKSRKKLDIRKMIDKPLNCRQNCPTCQIVVTPKWNWLRFNLFLHIWLKNGVLNVSTKAGFNTWLTQNYMSSAHNIWMCGAISQPETHVASIDHTRKILMPQLDAIFP